MLWFEIWPSSNRPEYIHLRVSPFSSPHLLVVPFSEHKHCVSEFVNLGDVENVNQARHLLVPVRVRAYTPKNILKNHSHFLNCLLFSLSKNEKRQAQRLDLIRESRLLPPPLPLIIASPAALMDWTRFPRMHSGSSMLHRRSQSPYTHWVPRERGCAAAYTAEGNQKNGRGQSHWWRRRSQWRSGRVC